MAASCCWVILFTQFVHGLYRNSSVHNALSNENQAYQIILHLFNMQAFYCNCYMYIGIYTQNFTSFTQYIFLCYIGIFKQILHGLYSKLKCDLDSEVKVYTLQYVTSMKDTKSFSLAQILVVDLGFPVQQRLLSLISQSYFNVIRYTVICHAVLYVVGHRRQLFVFVSPDVLVIDVLYK